MSQDTSELAAVVKRLAEHIRSVSAKREPRILVVDDLNDDLLLFKSALKEASGWGCELSRDGKEALAWIIRGGYDAVFLDLRMVPMDGVEVLRALQWVADKPPIVVVSGLDNGPMVNEAIRLGAMFHLQKPITVAKLREILGVIKL